MTATVYPGIAMDQDIEERWQSIAMEKRCDSQLRKKANDNKAFAHRAEGARINTL